MRVVILGSGRGSNARALLLAEKEGRLGKAEIVGVFSDKEEAPILGLGREFGKKSEYLAPGKFKTKLTGDAEEAYIRRIEEAKADLVVLAGFMRVIKPPFLRAFEGKILNLHPSLLPSFKGLNGIGQALAYGVKFTGCTVHWVSEEVDGGQILDQAVVPVLPDDTEETLGDRIHAAEHRLLVSVVAQRSLPKRK
ncbi:MAG: phosphoribosylglycinamide formyltransferase [Opitutales bacterium]|nr:phosphoribosylglycinamide formyltransferase [Opitutales bacterium]